MEYQKYFPEKKAEALSTKVGYLVNSSGKVEILKYHYFSKQDVTGLVCVKSNCSLRDAKEYAKVYGYVLKSGKELPENWEVTN